MAIVKTIVTKHAVVNIDDSAFANKSEAEIRRDQDTARRIAAGILYAAMQRGEVDGIEASENSCSHYDSTT